MKLMDSVYITININQSSLEMKITIDNIRVFSSILFGFQSKLFCVPPLVKDSTINHKI
jgi:hypothetical protein